MTEPHDRFAADRGSARAGGGAGSAPLIPYASHVGDATGRTPVGIMCFAASHLLLGAVIGLAMFRFIDRAPASSSLLPFKVLGVLTALTMIAGGATLLLKGAGAWVLCLTSFTWLALCESGLAGIGVALFTRDQAGWIAEVMMRYGLALAAVSAALFALCVVVLGYLASGKARQTFALPPGRTPAGVRWLPFVAIGIFVCFLMIGFANARPQ